MYVSDHAVLRYIERVIGLDVEAVRVKIASPTVQKAVDFGCETVVLGTGQRIILHGDVAVTVLPKGARGTR
ncbi:hypothetical protein D3Y57_19145 [Sphingomonas paeninsulae]|uniref:Uncharacterized protein n=1 Tax=Sphingomonas paeninsulae TaxID=2319844 RepID=A0A494TJU5_SPHPE|nr:hypothetical protein [Sphingomonas paeninsulae]AYJ87652.1 hypothetical protein D3Y57_19145 [Sphingomonas paeninsulae]